MTNTRSDYISKAKEDLDVLDARIAMLEARANEKTGEVHREFREKLNGLKENKAQAKRRLAELRLASKPAWEDAKRGVEQAWQSLSNAVDSISQRLQ